MQPANADKRAVGPKPLMQKVTDMKDKPVKIDDLRTWSTYMVDLLPQGRTSLLRDQIIYVLDNQQLTGALWLNKKHPCIDWDAYIYNPRFIRKGITPP